MKRIILFAVVLLLACSVSFAQKKHGNKAEMRKELRDFKMKFLAQEMDLKEDQQKKFFELYTQMSDEKEKLFKDTRSLERSLRDKKDATDAEYERVSDAITQAKAKEAEIDKKYDAKFSQFLSKKQIFKMKGAEDQFRHKMHEMRAAKKKK